MKFQYSTTDWFVDIARMLWIADLAQFTQNYDALTKGCNTCHRATKFGFNKIKLPDFNPYTNQMF